MDINRYDEKTKKLIETCMNQQRTRNSKAIASLEALKKVAEKQKDNELLGFACFYLANTHYRVNLNSHHFRSNLVKGISCLQQTNDHVLLARSYNYVGLDASNNGCYDVAYHYYMLALHITDTLDDPYLRSIININLGQLYAKLGNQHLARQTIRLAKKLVEQQNDDFYYNYNYLGCLYLDAALSIALKDYKGAKAADAALAKLEDIMPEDSLMGAQILIPIIRAQLAIIDNEREQCDDYFEQIMSFLTASDMLFDFIEDILNFCAFLIEQNELPYARRILDCINDNILRKDSPQMLVNITETEVRYYDTVKDEEKLNFFLHRQHDLEVRRQSEQNRIYFLSINLIDSIYEDIQRLSPGARKPVKAEIPDTQEYKDELTGLPNRLALSRVLSNGFDLLCEKQQPLGVALLHVENLPLYSDTYGRKAENILMQRIGLELRVIAYQYQMHCLHYEGDTFVMVFENMPKEEAEKIIDALTSKTATLDGGEADGYHLAVTIGVCNRIPSKEDSVADYMMEAHLALAEAKEHLGAGTHAVVFRS